MLHLYTLSQLIACKTWRVIASQNYKQNWGMPFRLQASVSDTAELSENSSTPLGSIQLASVRRLIFLRGWFNTIQAL